MFISRVINKPVEVLHSFPAEFTRTGSGDIEGFPVDDCPSRGPEAHLWFSETFLIGCPSSAWRVLGPSKCLLLGEGSLGCEVFYLARSSGDRLVSG